MKKITGLIVALLLVAAVGPFAFAAGEGASGRIIVPMVSVFYRSDQRCLFSTIALSNITNEELNCTVNYYDDNGDDYSSIINIYKGSNSSSESEIVSESNSFNMPAHSTRSVVFIQKKSVHIHGYAIVEWESSNKMIEKALVGGLRRYSIFSSGNNADTFSFINGGRPF